MSSIIPFLKTIDASTKCSFSPSCIFCKVMHAVNLMETAPSVTQHLISCLKANQQLPYNHTATCGYTFSHNFHDCLHHYWQCAHLLHKASKTWSYIVSWSMAKLLTKPQWIVLAAQSQAGSQSGHALLHALHHKCSTLDSAQQIA